MAKTPEQIAAKVKDIFAEAHSSSTPVSVMCLQSTILLGHDDWTTEEVEQVSGEVMALLIRHGWQKPSS
jgi:hypothetical protein